MHSDQIASYIKGLEAKAQAFDDMAEAIANAAGDFTRYWHAYSADYRAFTDKAEKGGDGARRATIMAEHALGKAVAYRIASEVLGDLAELMGVQ